MHTHDQNRRYFCLQMPTPSYVVLTHCQTTTDAKLIGSEKALTLTGTANTHKRPMMLLFRICPAALAQIKVFPGQGGVSRPLDRQLPTAIALHPWMPHGCMI